MKGENSHRKRPQSLVLAGVITFVLLIIGNWLFQLPDFAFLRSLVAKNEVLGPLLFPTGQQIEWKDRLQGLVLLLGLPVAFLLWLWRDQNVRDQIEEQRRQVENGRQDTNLKEFIEVQKQAAGAVDQSMPPEVREQLQIAGLHQLRGFLRGEYGESFKRPAFELLMAGHAAAIQRVGLLPPDFRNHSKNFHEVAKLLQLARERLTLVDRTRMLVICDEATHIFDPAYSLTERRFDLLFLDGKMLPTGLDLGLSSFVGARLHHCIMTNANFFQVDFTGTSFVGSSLNGAKLLNANLSASHLFKAKLQGAELFGTNIQKASFQGSDLRGAIFDPPNLYSAEFKGALVDKGTAYFEVLVELGAVDAANSRPHGKTVDE